MTRDQAFLPILMAALAVASLSLMDSAAGSMGRGTSVHSMDPPMDRMRIAFIDPFGYSSTGAAGFDRHGRCPKDDIVWRSSK